MSTTARLKMLFDNAVTVVGCTPTYALRLAEVAAEEGLDLRNSTVRALLVAGEPGGNIPATRQRLEQAWDARVIDHWGMTELGPLAIEAEDAPGTLTVLETDCIAEIVDTLSGEPVAQGTEGELVITTLTRWGSPLVRYRTGDRVRARPGKGLLTLDGGILGRVDEMLTIRGNNVYPAALEDVLRQFTAVAEFRIEVRNERAMQHVRVDIEPAPGTEHPEDLCRRIATAIRDRWNFQAEVACVTGLPRFEMKARRFFKS
jgi:phenylacetate-CoA ligase